MLKKASSLFTSKNKAAELMTENQGLKAKSDKLHAKANTLKANYDKAKNKVEQNENLQRAFKQGINDIDKALIDKGRRYMNMK